MCLINKNAVLKVAHCSKPFGMWHISLWIHWGQPGGTRLFHLRSLLLLLFGTWGRAKSVSSLTVAFFNANSIFLMLGSPFLCFQSAFLLKFPFFPQLLDFFVFLLRFEMSFLETWSAELICDCDDCKKSVPFTWIICILSSDTFESLPLSLVRCVTVSLRWASFTACSSSMFRSFSSSSGRDESTVITKCWY